MAIIMIIISKNGNYNDCNKQKWRLKLVIFACLIIITITSGKLDYNKQLFPPLPVSSITISDYFHNYNKQKYLQLNDYNETFITERRALILNY